MRQRVINCVLLTLLAISMFVPGIAIADDVQSSIEYYEKMEYVFGVAYDLNDFTSKQGWLNAYVDLLSTFSSPTQLKTMALRLEQAYGHDIVTADGTGLYKVTEGSGGAFQSSRLDTFNQVRNITILTDWMDYIIENGPAWPYPGNSSAEGNTDQGDYVRMALRKSFAENSSLLVSDCNYNGVEMGFGPASSKTPMSPDVIYILVSKQVINNLANAIGGDYKIIVTINFTYRGGSTYWANLGIYAYPKNGVELVWNEYNLSYNNQSTVAKGATFTYPSASTAYVSQTITSLMPDQIINTGTVRNGSASGNTYTYTGYYVSAVLFDGTYTEPEGDSTETPTNPGYDRPETPTTPLPPDTSGNASPTVDVKPITDRLDTIIGEIAAFEGQFWSYHRDALNFWGEIYDMLSYWLSKIEANTRNTAGWARNISYQLNLIQAELDSIGDTYRPVITSGNTMQQQLADDLDLLKGKFPFSLPWDLLALLMMLEAPRHSMVFTVPMAYFGQTANLTIDLSSYSQVGIVSRAISRWLFGFYLVTRTKDLLLKGE